MPNRGPTPTSDKYLDDLVAALPVGPSRDAIKALRAEVERQTKDYDDCAALLLEANSELERLKAETVKLAMHTDEPILSETRERAAFRLGTMVGPPSSETDAETIEHFIKANVAMSKAMYAAFDVVKEHGVEPEAWDDESPKLAVGERPQDQDPTQQETS